MCPLPVSSASPHIVVTLCVLKTNFPFPPMSILMMKFLLSGPKNDPPSIVQEKVLNLIQSWADAFHNQPELSAVVQIYNDLRKKGIEFPMTDLDMMAPIHTPRKVRICQFIILLCFHYCRAVFDARMISRQSIFHFIV